MNIHRRIVIFLALISLVAGASALIPDDVVVSTDHQWVIAGSANTSIINVQVTNSTNPSDPVEGAAVTVWCEDSEQGHVTPSSVQYIGNTSTNVTFTFHTGTKSGNAILHAQVTYPGMPEPKEGTTIQRVDHAAPASFAELVYPATAPVGSMVTIQVRLKDRYGNTVNSLREEDELRVAENISFRDSEDGDGGFGAPNVNTINATVDSSGYATVQYQLSSLAGDNVISIKPPATVSPSQTFITIKGIGVASANITAELDPSSGVVYVGYDIINILYTVTDIDGNPIKNATILRTTELGEFDSFITNNEGQVLTTYGPKSSVGIVNITATVEGYPNVMVVSTIEFVHTDPVMWELTARQQTLASRDVKEDITADIMAKVMDALGNPVEGETVTFAIVNPTNTTLLTTPSELVDSMAITDIDGFARILFRPGAFPRWGETGYNDTATGTATVRATWNGRTKDIVITFRNYPYLRVEAEVSPETIRVNETVNVTVRLIGDGWALRPKPIDVLLVTDRSGSMLEDNPDRMVPVKDASKAFAQEMALSQSQDHVGLVSFGESGWANLSPTRYYSHGWHWDWSNVYGSWYWVYRDGYNDCNTGDSYSTSSVHHQYLVTNYGGGNKYYANYADVDISLNWSSSTINNSINSMVPSGGTPMRLGVYKAIKEMNDTGRNSAVKAIIVLSDGDYNWYGDPLARGSAGQTSNPENYPYRTNDQPNTYYWSFSGLTTSEQNLSVYARNHNIRIYAIGYAADISDYGRTTLRTLAESTGGKYYTGTAANIAEIYQTIAGELKTVAGVNTTMNLNFQNVNVTYNNLTTATPGDEVFAYQHVGGESTFVSSWNNSGILPDHVPIPPYANVSPNFGSYTTYNYSFDQSSDWIADPPHLHFAVGNISINQTWQTTFRLKVLKEGSINVFGQGSSVNFDGSEGIYSTNITDTFITAIANMTAEAANQTVLDVAITGTNDDGSGNITEILDIYWNLDYSGNRTVQQDFYYQFSDDNVIWSGSWVHGGSITTGTGPISNVSQTGGIDVRGKSGWMKIKVTAKEQLIGGKYDEDYWPQVIRVGPGDKIYIRIT